MFLHCITQVLYFAITHAKKSQLKIANNMSIFLPVRTVGSNFYFLFRHEPNEEEAQQSFMQDSRLPHRNSNRVPTE
jgi:hypothetical protein